MRVFYYIALMKHLTIEYQGGHEHFKAPDNWEEVPFFKYISFLELTYKKDFDAKEVFKLMFGLSDEALNSDMRVQMVHRMNEQLNFLSEEPQEEKIPDWFKYKGEFYRVPLEIGEMTLSKYRDMVETASEILQGIDKTPLDMLKTYPEIIAIFLTEKEGYTQTDLVDLAKEVEKLPTSEVVTLGGFFLNKFANLKNGTRPKWYKRLAIKIRKAQDLGKSQKILVIS